MCAVATSLLLPGSATAQSYARFGDQSAEKSSSSSVEKSTASQARFVSPASEMTGSNDNSVASSQAHVPRVSMTPTASSITPENKIQLVGYQQPAAYPSRLSNPLTVTDQDRPRQYMQNEFKPSPALARQIRQSYTTPRMATKTPSPSRMSRLSRQDDPFGDRQKPPVAKPQPIENSGIPSSSSPFGDTFKREPTPISLPELPLTSPQEDPFGDKQKPPSANPTTPTGSDNTLPPKRPTTDPTQPRGTLPGEQDPIKNPPGTDPRGQEPILPKDAQPNNSNPIKPPTMATPNENTPEVDWEADGGEQNELRFGPEPRIDDSIDYANGKPMPEWREPSTNIYRAPSNQQGEPIPYANQIHPYQGTPRGQYFVPAFDPIPGINQGQTFVPAAPRYPQSVVIAPQQQYGYPTQPTPAVAQPLFAQERQVYAPAIAKGVPPYPTGGHTCDGSQGCGDYGTAQHGGVVGQGIGQRGFLRNLVADDSTIAQAGNFDCPAFYFAFQGGSNDLQTLVGDSNNELETDSGSAFTFALGRINGRNLRTEIELAIRNNDISDLISGGTSQSFSGDISAFSGMANAYWEFVDFPGGRFKPYIGFGLGFASLETTLADAAGASVLTANGGSDTSFAYQWMAGVNYKTSSNLDVFAEYRFFEADSTRIDSTRAGFSDNYNYQSNTVGIGLRWKF